MHEYSIMHDGSEDQNAGVTEVVPMKSQSGGFVCAGIVITAVEQTSITS